MPPLTVSQLQDFHRITKAHISAVGEAVRADLAARLDAIERRLEMRDPQIAAMKGPANATATSVSSDSVPQSTDWPSSDTAVAMADRPRLKPKR
jgi:hypothetical protein